MRRFMLDGHMLEVKFVGRGREMVVEKSAKAGGEKGKERKKKKTRMVVENLLFEPNKKELWELFWYVFTQ
jgi:hypothetical protein